MKRSQGSMSSRRCFSLRTHAGMRSTRGNGWTTCRRACVGFDDIALDTFLARCLVCREEPFDVLEPVDCDVDPRGGLLIAGPDHQEPLAVGRHVVLGEDTAGPTVMSYEKPARLSHLERWRRLHLDGHHGVALTVEELASPSRPRGFSATFRRNRHVLA